MGYTASPVTETTMSRGIIAMWEKVAKEIYKKGICYEEYYLYICGYTMG